MAETETVLAWLAALRLDPAGAEAVGSDSLRLRRAWPREGDHLLLEYTTPEGRIVGAQWMRDPAALERIAADVVARSSGRALLQRTGEIRVLIQPAGADRRLPFLSSFLARTRGTLISHRVERRAVVDLRESAGRCVKFVRKIEALRAAVECGRAIADSGAGSFTAPRPLEINEPEGWIAWSYLPGHSWQRAIVERADPDLSRAVGTALRELHSITPPAGLPTHVAGAELRVLQAWTERAARFGLVGRERLAEESRIAAALVAGGSPLCLVHRDFHDRQVLINADRAVGIIDFDTLAIGEPAVDLANALAHLDWAAARALAPAALIAEHAEAFLSGYDPSPATRVRIPPYRHATQLRLECVHAFRPRV